jgi:hypothetical protein
MMTNEMQWFLQGVAFCALLMLAKHIIEHRWRTRKHRKAISVVRGVGLEAHHYTPSFEVNDDELVAAFNELASSGYIVASPSGHVVGVMRSTRGHDTKRLIARSASL